MTDPAAARKHFLAQLNIHDEDDDTALCKLKNVPFSEMIPVIRSMWKVRYLFIYIYTMFF